ncbi:MAG: dTDP-4-dehydrorhamnose 3,5-epimerase family protein [Helicobacteraceae bacterium]|jgi:dTDP-4-dehydrorhamnose 3,5-epimerase|nr:dTDP-4-dehydrorhamnose 3,5-epimerase family protein [Helicobacteraceae bacterium]
MKTPPYLEETSLPGLMIFYPHQAQDDRGWFRKIYQMDFLKNNGWDFSFMETYCHKTKKGVIRGLDFSLSPDDKKMIYCVQGEAMAVFVSLANGEHQGKRKTIELSGDDPKIVLLSNGFCSSAFAKTDIIMVNSSCLAYQPNINFKINPYDPDLAIEWPAHISTPPPIQGYVSFAQAKKLIEET